MILYCTILIYLIIKLNKQLVKKERKNYIMHCMTQIVMVMH